jgi:hypothetical protein
MPRVSRAHSPPPPPSPRRHHCTTPTHHLPLPFHTARPQPSHGSSAAGFGPTPHPCLAFCERTAPHHHHQHHLICAVLHTIPHRCSTRHALNRAKAGFGPNPPRFTFRERTAPPPPPSHCTCHRATLRTILHCRSTWHAQNRTPVARFWVLSP